MLIRYFFPAILLFTVVYTNPVFGQENEAYLQKYSYYLKAPEDFLVLSEDLFLVNDPANSEYQIYKLEMKEGEIISRIRTGRGPGELGGARYKTMMYAANGDISVFDRGLIQTNIYDRDLNYIQTLKYFDVGKGFMQAGFIDDTTHFGINAVGDFLNAYQYEINDLSLESTPLWSVANNENEFFAPLENFLLKQDIHFEQDNGSLYMGFKYDSLLIKVDREGIDYFTVEPEHDLLPDEKPENDRIYSLPDIGTYPICTLDVDVQDEFLYVLYSGEKVSGNFFSSLFSGDEAIERIKHSKRVFKFEKNTGKFLAELEVPIQAKNIEITQDHIYILSFINDEMPTIYKYPFEAMTEVGM